MDVLIDTHTLLWFVRADTQLSSTAKTVMLDEANRKLVSMASIWELAIKINIGKLNLDIPLTDFLAETVDGNGFELLAIDKSHVNRIVDLPLHHRDPFDRLLIAQSLVEEMPVVSVDAIFDSYGVMRLW
jgi:PIN domain nuclease of toxin-antitoxin system